MRLQVYRESFELQSPLSLAWGTYDGGELVVVEVGQNENVGFGECCPVPAFGETPENVIHEIRSVAEAAGEDLSRDWLSRWVSPGPTRNAIDAALWDLEAKKTGKTIWDITNIKRPLNFETAITIGIDTPKKMGIKACSLSSCPVIKLKLGKSGDDDRIKSVRDSLPFNRIIVDANCGWSRNELDHLVRICMENKIEMIEQPLKPYYDGCMSDFVGSIPFVADESFINNNNIDYLKKFYSGVNVKLDTVGGLTQAISLAKRAKEKNMDVMAGCRFATSLGCAPSFVIAALARWVDLDAPLFLKKDRPHSFQYSNGIVDGYQSVIWG